MRKYIALLAIVLFNLIQTSCSASLDISNSSAIKISRIAVSTVPSGDVSVMVEVKGTEEITEVSLVYCLLGELTVEEAEKPASWPTKKRSVEPMKVEKGKYAGIIPQSVASQGEVCFFIEVQDAVGARAVSSIHTVE